MAPLKHRIPHDKSEEYHNVAAKFLQADTLAGEGQWDKAEALLRECLAWAMRTLGPAHEMTVSYQGDVAIFLAQVGKYDEAIKLNTAALTARKKANDQSPARYSVQLNLARDLAQRRKLEEAASQFENLFQHQKDSQTSYGEDHPDTLRTGFELANCWFLLGKRLNNHTLLNKAKCLHQDVLDRQLKAVGHDQLEIAQTRAALGQDHYQLEDYTKAQVLFNENAGALRSLETKTRKHPSNNKDVNDQRLLEIESLLQHCTVWKQKTSTAKKLAAERTKAQVPDRSAHPVREPHKHDTPEREERMSSDNKQEKSNSIRRDGATSSQLKPEDMGKRPGQRASSAGPRHPEKRQENQQSPGGKEVRRSRSMNNGKGEVATTNLRVDSEKVGNPRPSRDSHLKEPGSLGKSSFPEPKLQQGSVLKVPTVDERQPSKGKETTRMPRLPTPEPEKGHKEISEPPPPVPPAPAPPSPAPPAPSIPKLRRNPPSFNIFSQALPWAAGTLCDAEDGGHSQGSEKWFRDLESMTHSLLHPLQTGSFKRPRVAVLDTGIHMEQLNLWDKRRAIISNGENPRIKRRKDFLEGEHNTRCVDEDGHGTHCVGVIRRVAPEADIYVARVATRRGECPDTTAVAKAVKHAREKWAVDIISLSMGFEEWDEPLEKEIKDAISNKILFLAAASNYGTRRPMTFPARMPDVITIHAADYTGTAANTNPAIVYGKQFTILGVDVKSAWIPTEASRVPATHSMSGTSVATPVAAGVAALVLEFAMQRDVTDKDTDNILGFLRDYLKRQHGMNSVFNAMSQQTNGGDFLNIVPWKVLCGHRDDRIGRRMAAYSLLNTIEEAFGVRISPK